VMLEMKTDFRWNWTRGILCSLCLIWLCVAEVDGARAQSAADATQAAGHFRLLSAQQGKAIIGAALEENQAPSGAQDCSHLVHQIYAEAGFEYAYASSFELYTGNENFARVKYPRAGDLIAWPGHVGIVLEPSKHSFYSLVSTGVEAQDYDGRYWRSRGRPRFYRYKMGNAGILTASKTPGPSRTSNSAKYQEAELAAEDRSGAGARDSNRPPETAKKIGYGLPAPATPAAASGTFDAVRSIVIAPGKKQPTKAEVAEGISQLSNASGSVLRADDPAKLAAPVVIFERFQVERLELKRDHGWAHLQIDSRATIAGGETDYTRKRERVKWELQRTASGWEAIAPAERTYVPQDVAVRNLAAQLARVTEGDGAAAQRESVLRQESQLAKLISGLLDKK
jgi:NlpC/P60 family